MGSPADGNSTLPSMPFCDSAMSMTMYMDGFRSSLFAYLFTPTPSPPPPAGGADNMDGNMDSDDLSLPCLNFLLKRWTLDTPAKFVGAMIAMILLGITAEGLAAARSGGWIPSWAHRLARQCCSCWSCCCSSNARGGGGRSLTNRRGRQFSKSQRWFVKMCIISTHIVQALVGYVLMLAAMSYSLELLGSVLLGLGIGYATFFDLDDKDGHTSNDGYDEVGQEDDEDDDPANDGTTTTTAARGGGNGHRTGNGNTAVGGVGTSSTSCCDVAGRGPPRRAFQFLRSPVPTLAGAGINRRMSPRNRGTSDGNDGDADEANAATSMAIMHGGSHGDGADNLSLHEDDKMTPLL